MKKTQKDIILRYCLQNAVFYNGRADSKAVLGKILGSVPELRGNVRTVKLEVEKTVKEINRKSPDKQRELLESMAPEMLKKEEKKQEELPPLHNAIKGKVVTRFAPSPSGPLMLPHLLRAVFLNYLYAKKYKGRFVLRIEDTDPANIKKEYYDWIKEDLKNAGVKWDKLVIESNNMDLYYKHAEKLIGKEDIYACHCPAEKFREFKVKKQNCPCRDNQGLEEWNKALKGKYEEGQIVFRLKTSMKDPNPALRDPPMLRIIKASHPFKKRKYNVWPLYNYANVIEDHNSGITHVFRGKEHEHNTNIQRIVYQKLGWKMPEVINFGMVYLPGEKLHTRDIKIMLEKGRISGWDDPKLSTVRALIRRGFQPDAFKQAALTCSLTKTDIRFSWEILEAANRKIIDSRANRYMIVTDPVKISVKGMPDIKEVQEPFHPDFPKKGKKKMPLDPKEIHITREDYNNLKGKEFRLKGFGNIKLKAKTGFYTSNEILRDMQKIQWVSKPNVNVRILKPDGELNGLGEQETKKLKVGSIIQMERVGFGRVDKKGKEVVIVFGHK